MYIAIIAIPMQRSDLTRHSPTWSSRFWIQTPGHPPQLRSDVPLQRGGHGRQPARLDVRGRSDVEDG
jgi:hypothetical protein